MPVQCSNCGYLAKHGLSARAGSERYFEIDAAERDNPDAFFSHLVDGFAGGFPTELACFIHKADLAAEIGASVNDPWMRNVNAIGVVRTQRECDGFLPHVPGFSPKEHLEIYKMQRLEQDRREFDERLAKRDEDVHTALVKAQQAFQLERERAQEPTTKLMKRLTWLAVALAAVQVAIGLTPESLIVKAIVRLWRLIFG